MKKMCGLSVLSVSMTCLPALGQCNPGDFDGDGDVDLVDFGAFQLAYTGADCFLRWGGKDMLGGGVNGDVNAFAVYDDGGGPALYVGGEMGMAGGVVVNGIAKWDGKTWSALGSGIAVWLNEEVGALVVYDDGTGPALYAMGEFTAAGGVAASRIAKWDGKQWSALGLGIGPGAQPLFALAVYDDGNGSVLYAGGTFNTAGGIPIAHIARWNGLEWSPVGTGPGSWVTSLVVFDAGDGTALYAASEGVQKWDGERWSEIGSGGVFSLAIYDDGIGPALVAGGNSGTIAGIEESYIAKWDGATWSPLGKGVNTTVRALAVYNDGHGDALFAAGSFTMAGGTPVNRIAKWDGRSWSALGSGLGGDGGSTPRPFALIAHDDGHGPALFVGGDFWTAGGIPSRAFAKWYRPTPPCPKVETALHESKRN